MKITMPLSGRLTRSLAVALGVSLAFVPAPNVFAAGAQYDQPLAISASSVLPAGLISGPNHLVQQQVVNDGFLNIYTINSKYGQLRAVSTATLQKRIGELNAMAGMERVKGTDEFKQGLAGKAGDIVEGGVGIIKDPVGSLSGAASGVKSLFKSVSATVEHGKSDTESGRLSVISGFDKTKREYAYEFNVDVYSRNEYLQDALNDVSRAGFLGTSVVRIGTAAVSGAAGAALSVAGNTQALNEMLREKTAGDLRVMLDQSLQKLGVNEDVADLFIGNRAFTLTEQVAIVLALESMPATANRAAFIKFAVATDNADMAAFRHRQADMYAGYNRKVKPIVSFEYLGQIAAARTKDGAVVINAPLDHLLWTAEMASFIEQAQQRLGALQGVTSRELWVAGTLSPLARSNLEATGWKIQERANIAITGG
jgi:hypothetical protein